jgi:type VI secretion system protein ImpK
MGGVGRAPPPIANKASPARAVSRKLPRDVEQTIGVFGEEMLLWLCVLRQSPRRPQAEHVHRQANLLLDELKATKIALELPVETVDDGMFAIAALLDEIAMSMPDLRPLWANHPLQATRWTTNNAGVEVFQRLDRVRQGPKMVFATYVTVLGLGFQGRFGLPGADRYALAQLRRELHIQMGVDTDKDWTGGVLKPSRADVAKSVAAKEAWWRSLLVGRILAVLTLLSALTALTLVLAWNLG